MAAHNTRIQAIGARRRSNEQQAKNQQRLGRTSKPSNSISNERYVIHLAAVPADVTQKPQLLKCATLAETFVQQLVRVRFKVVGIISLFAFVHVISKSESV